MRISEIQSAQGTYAKLLLSATSNQNLTDYCEQNNIDPIDEFHCTLAYSRVVVPEIESYHCNLPIITTPVGFKLFPSQTGDALVLLLDSDELVDIFNEFKEFGATWDYPEFQPHLTLNYNFTGNTKLKVPEFDIIFNKFVAEELDLNKYSEK